MNKNNSMLVIISMVIIFIILSSVAVSQNNQNIQDGKIIEYNNDKVTRQSQELQTRPFKLLKRNKVHLQALDKITARISDLYVNTGQQIRFQAIVIDVNVCYDNPPEEKPESIAHIVIHEDTPNLTDIQIFQGWMYSSSPAINGMEHPVYDVWVSNCIVD